MKIKKGFMLRRVADTWVVIPLGERVVDFNGMISLSESGALLWKRLLQGAELDDLVRVLTQEYEVDEKTAVQDCTEFAESVRANGLLE